MRHGQHGSKKRRTPLHRPNPGEARRPPQLSSDLHIQITLQIHIISNEMYPTISKLTTWPCWNQAKAKLTVPVVEMLGIVPPVGTLLFNHKFGFHYCQ